MLKFDKGHVPVSVLDPKPNFVVPLCLSVTYRNQSSFILQVKKQVQTLRQPVTNAVRLGRLTTFCHAENFTNILFLKTAMSEVLSFLVQIEPLYQTVV